MAVDARRVVALRAEGLSWATICEQTGLTKGTAQRALHNLPKNPLPGVPVVGSGGTGVLTATTARRDIGSEYEILGKRIAL